MRLTLWLVHATYGMKKNDIFFLLLLVFLLFPSFLGLTKKEGKKRRVLKQRLWITCATLKGRAIADLNSLLQEI